MSAFSFKEVIVGSAPTCATNCSLDQKGFERLILDLHRIGGRCRRITARYPDGREYVIFEDRELGEWQAG